MDEKLTEKQKRFIDFYIETGNASEACRLSGYKSKNFDALGSENKVKLSKYIKVKIEEKDNARICSQNEVLYYLSSVLRDEATEECIVVTSNGQGCGSSHQIVDKKLSGKDRLLAAQQISKIFGFSSRSDSEKFEFEKHKFEVERKMKDEGKTEGNENIRESLTNLFTLIQTPQPNRTLEDVENYIDESTEVDDD